MRRHPTEWEKRMWRHLSNSQLGFRFRRQAVIFPDTCDFFCPAKGLVMEIDGDTHDPPYDAARNAPSLNAGFATTRFTNLAVRDAPGGVLTSIVNVLVDRPGRWPRPPK